MSCRLISYFLNTFDYMYVLFDSSMFSCLLFMYVFNYAGQLFVCGWGRQELISVGHLIKLSSLRRISLHSIGSGRIRGIRGLIVFISLYNNGNHTEDGDSPFQFNSSNCSYCEPPDFQRYIHTGILRDQISVFIFKLPRSLRQLGFI